MHFFHNGYHLFIIIIILLPFTKTTNDCQEVLLCLQSQIYFVLHKEKECLYSVTFEGDSDATVEQFKVTESYRKHTHTATDTMDDAT